jgi:oligopeptide transport system substrate-binding protein
MTRFHFLLLTICLFLASCSGNDRKQFESAGGTLTLALDNAPTTFIAREVTDVYSQRVLSQALEPLVTINPKDFSIQPQLAKSWKASADGLTYTFVLRDDVLFHENELFGSDDERRMTAADVKYSIEKACRPNEKGLPSSAYASTYADLLLGAKDYYSGKRSSIAGLRVNGNEVVLTLTAPDATFIQKMAQINSAVISEKAAKANKEGELIGTGPFVYLKPGSDNRIVLVKNEDYYLRDNKGNALPYLDSVVFVIENRKLEQLDLFEKGGLDMISALPASRITQMLEGRIGDFNSKPPKMILYNNALLNTQYYFFNMADPRFQDVRVRKAFNYAVNREKITREVLRGQASENGIYGIVPPVISTFRGYDFKAVRDVGYDFDPEKAKQLLAEAGFPNGQGFGSVNLRVNTGDIHSAVAEEVSRQIFQVLNINVNIDGSTFDQKDADADFARGDIFRSAWLADYPSPETFLMNFCGKYVPEALSEPSQINQSRYRNPVFDDYMNRARVAPSQTERYKLYNSAEIELMKDPPLIVLWYAGDIQLMSSKVRNFAQNSLGLLDLRQVYLKEWTREEYLKSVQ